MKFENSERATNQDISSSENERQQEGKSLKYEDGVGIRFTELLKNESGTEAKHEKQETTDELVEQKIGFAKNETEKIIADGQKRIGGIEQGIGLPEKDIAEVRAEVGLSGRLEKIKDGAGTLFSGLKEKISGFFSKKENTNPQAGEKSQEYEDTKEYLRREQRELSAPVIREARMKRDQLLEARGLLQMPKNDFNSFFASKDFEIRNGLNQQNVGDCYAVAAIHAMSRSPHFEMICRSSMKRNPDGSWQVKVPLMSEGGETITITPEELSPQWNKKFLRRKKEGGMMPDLRMRLMPVKGKEGLQVLEAAFIKAKFGSVDRLAAEGGWEDEVLLQLGGDNFAQYTLNSARYNEEGKKWEYPGLSSLPEQDAVYLDHYLENFDPEIHIATASTKHIGKGDSTSYKGKGTKETFVAGHAYSVSNIDSEHKKIILANPWDTAKPIELTFEQFKENFSGFAAIRIDSAKLLSNMRRVEKKAA